MSDADTLSLSHQKYKLRDTSASVRNIDTKSYANLTVLQSCISSIWLSLLFSCQVCLSRGLCSFQLWHWSQRISSLPSGTRARVSLKVRAKLFLGLICCCKSGTCIDNGAVLSAYSWEILTYCRSCWGTRQIHYCWRSPPSGDDISLYACSSGQWDTTALCRVSQLLSIRSHSGQQ